MLDGEDVVPEPVPEENRDNLEEQEQTLEEIGMQLLERLDAIDARLTELEARLSGYSAIDHQHEQQNPPTPRPDEQPRPDRFWFRRLGE